MIDEIYDKKTVAENIRLHDPAESRRPERSRCTVDGDGRKMAAKDSGITQLTS